MKNGIKKDYILPASIIIAALLISGSWIYTSGIRAPEAGKAPTDAVRTPAADTDSGMKPVTADDHILGNPDAPVQIVEYSDLECPFCKAFHPTMKQIMREYGADGRVAWVYRHFPPYKGGGGQPPLHSKAGEEAEASECAAELGGNDRFWAYIDRVFEITPSNNQLDLEQLPVIARDIGLDQNKFKDCLLSNKYADKIEASYEDAVASGALGTPYSIAITKSGKQLPINGALPVERVRQIIEQALQ